MNINKYIKDNILLITPSSYKEHILSHTKKLLNIKCMTLQQLFENFLFSYDQKAIYYLMKKYQYRYSVAKMYLDHLYYIDHINDPKILKLKKLKQELKEQQLLYYNDFFNDYLKHNEVVILGYSLTKFDLKVIKQIEQYTVVHILEEAKENSKILDAYEFPTMEDEICFIATQIIKLLKRNISYQNIKVMNIDDTYYNCIKRIFGFYNLDISITDTSLYSNYKIQKFLRQLKENKNLNNAISLLDSTAEWYPDIIDICNHYAFLKQVDSYMIECIEEEIKKINIESSNKCLKVYSLEDYVSDEDYVFLINFNQNSIPMIHKDEDYLSDSLKFSLGLDTSFSWNQLEKKKVVNKISSISNLTITYKLESPYQQYYPSILIRELNMNVKREVVEDKYLYSHLYNKVELTKKLDQLIRYNEKSNDLDLLYCSSKDIDYLTYDNQFTGINQQELKRFLNHQLILSYSAIDEYYRCGFRYYISRILKLSKYEETFAIFIGNLFHYILSIAFFDSFDFEKEFSKYLENRTFTFKETFFLEKLKKELLFVIETIQKQNQLSLYNQELYEDKIYQNETGTVKVTLMGVIDKLKYYSKNGTNYVAIIDYKTGTPDTNLKNTVYGIGMQLPIYLYLAKKTNKIHHVEITGIYFQKILNQKLPRNIEKDYYNEKQNQLKLEGYSIDKEKILEKFDITYKDSKLIKGLKYGINGFYSFSKVLSENQIQALDQLVETKIEEAKQNILEAKFMINPKRIGNDLKGCEFCKYKDLCYKKGEDIIHLEEYKDLSFLESKK